MYAWPVHGVIRCPVWPQGERHPAIDLGDSLKCAGLADDCAEGHTHRNRQRTWRYRRRHGPHVTFRMAGWAHGMAGWMQVGCSPHLSRGPAGGRRRVLPAAASRRRHGGGSRSGGR